MHLIGCVRFYSNEAAHLSIKWYYYSVFTAYGAGNRNFHSGGKARLDFRALICLRDAPKGLEVEHSPRVKANDVSSVLYNIRYIRILS